MNRRNPSEEERFWAKVRPAGACGVWTGSKTAQGYGLFSVDGRRVLAHRWAYERFVGPIPDGLEIDHECRNRGCIRPEHLRAVTRKQNIENRRAPRRSSSGVRGVTWNRKAGKWVVQVGHLGRVHYGGLFTDLAEADLAARALRDRLFAHHTDGLEP